MIVGITGGAGFIGSYVAEELKARGHKPFVLDHKGRLEHGMLGDVRDSTAVMELAAHVDAIIHLAAVLGTQETIRSPFAATETNVVGTLNVFEAASHYDLPVVFAAVGNANVARGTYCVTKLCGERFVQMYREDRDLRVIAVRPMNAFGPRQSAPTPFGSAKVRKIVPSFVCSALSGIPMPVYGGGTQISDSIYVGDVARVFVSAIESASKGIVPNHPIDAGNITPSSVIDVARCVQKYVEGAVIEELPMRAGEPHEGPVRTQNQLLQIVDAVCETNTDLRRIDVRRVVRELSTVVSADTSTLETIGIDATTFTPLDQALPKTIDWFRANEGVTWHKPQNKL